MVFNAAHILRGFCVKKSDRHRGGDYSYEGADETDGLISRLTQLTGHSRNVAHFAKLAKGIQGRGNKTCRSCE